MAGAPGAREIVEHYRDGDVVVREGETGRAMYVIQKGRVRIVKHGVELAVLQRGNFFGEMSLLESMPRDADAIALGETQLLVISPGALLVRIRRDPTFAYEMLYRLSGRIRNLNARLIKVLEGETAPEATKKPVLIVNEREDG